MKFNVGPYSYSLKIAKGKIVSSGHECFGATVEGDREILISADCPPGERLRVLTRQLMFAWTYAAGTPTTTQDWCDLSAMALKSLMRDLRSQGGEATIKKLTNGGVP